MDRMNTRIRLLLGTAALIALLVVPVAVAGTEGDSGSPQATASSVRKTVKTLKKQVKEARQAIAGLQQQVAALQGEQGRARTPSGPAGGDLAGSYPNPQIGPNAVGSSEIASDAVGNPEIAANAVGVGKIGSGAVGSDELAAISLITNAVSVASGGGTNTVAADCPAGSELISGGATFDFPTGDLSASIPSGNGWFARGENNGIAAQSLTVFALCLPG